MFRAEAIYQQRQPDARAAQITLAVIGIGRASVSFDGESVFTTAFSLFPRLVVVSMAFAHDWLTASVMSDASAVYR